MGKLPPKSLIQHHLELSEELGKAVSLEFDTYEKAIEAIVLLREQKEALQRTITASEIKRKRGAPKKQKSVLTELFKPVNKKKGGRQIQYHDMDERIKQWDVAREKLAKELSKKSVTDLRLVEHLIEKNCKTMNRTEKASLKKTMRTGIKYLRDQTGMRIHKRKKAENPSK